MFITDWHWIVRFNDCLLLFIGSLASYCLLPLWKWLLADVINVLYRLNLRWGHQGHTVWTLVNNLSWQRKILFESIGVMTLVLYEKKKEVISHTWCRTINKFHMVILLSPIRQGYIKVDKLIQKNCWLNLRSACPSGECSDQPLEWGQLFFLQGFRSPVLPLTLLIFSFEL